ncbi:hypothetical protein GCM10011507_13520 [Edaphobacter acidisoli]|uniref:DUF4386 family protein n=1 Tax=Edaphobacter acidisoli TaxID=2040573 RepID=A0A916W3L8_9BACT|nr:hypothetical protein [Edaphobacter acidisoli]GGA63181.1 hypothetical protein GCM10011507_13520 [Edaphobacter acidisoli]
MYLQRHAKAVLLTLTVMYVVLLKAGGSNVSVAFHVPHDGAVAVAFVAQHSWAIRWGSFCEFVSAIPLGIFMALSVGLLRSSGARSGGEQIAALGGIAAPMMLVGSALATWSLTRPGVAAATGAVVALQSLGFDGGGPGFAVFLGLFVAGVSVAAGKLLPRWLMGLGIVVAAAGVLSALTLMNFTAGYFIPVARFLSIVWMVGFALKLPAAVPLSEDRRAALAGEPGY